MIRPVNAAACLAVLALAGCGHPLFDCGETRSVPSEATLAVTAVPGAAPPPGDSLGRLPAALGLGFELYDFNMERLPGVFGDVVGVVARGESLGSGQGLSLMWVGGVRGRDATTARLVLVLPTPLRAGARYPIGGTVPAPVGLHNPDVYGYTQYGRRALRTPGRAEAGLFWGHTRFVPPDPFAVEFPEFAARSTSGSVEVVSDRGSELRLRLDMVAADSAGRPLRFQGDVAARYVVEDRQCNS